MARYSLLAFPLLLFTYLGLDIAFSVMESAGRVTVDVATYGAVASVFFCSFVSIFFFLILIIVEHNSGHIKEDRRGNEKGIWLYLPILLTVFPFLVKLLSLASIRTFFGDYIGFFYLESVCLSYVCLYYLLLMRRRFGREEKEPALLTWITGITLLVCVFFVAILSFTQIYFWKSFLANSATKVEFVEGATNSMDPLIRLGSSVYWLFSYNAFHGLLGIIFGIFSVFVALIGSAFGECVKKKLRKIATALTAFVVMITIVISVMTFAVYSAYFHSLIHSVAVTSLLLSVVFLSLGSLVESGEKTMALSVLMVSAVSFGTGFIFGSLVVSLTTTALFSTSLGVFCYVSPQSYFFMLSAMSAVAILGYMLQDDRFPLSKIMEGIVDKLSLPRETGRLLFWIVMSCIIILSSVLVMVLLLWL